MLKCILELHGKNKFYHVGQSATGDMYNFDSDFIDSLKLYLAGEENSMTKSQLNNIKLFVDFADGRIESSHKDYKALVEFDKYLVEMGV